MNIVLGYAANQVNSPWMMVIIGVLAVGILGGVLWNAFVPKKDLGRRVRMERKPRATSASGRFI